MVRQKIIKIMEDKYLCFFANILLCNSADPFIMKKNDVIYMYTW